MLLNWFVIWKLVARKASALQRNHFSSSRKRRLMRARLGRERLGREALFMLRVPMRGGTEKADLLSIAPTPFAESQMNAQADAAAPAKAGGPAPRIAFAPPRGNWAKARPPFGKELSHFHQRIHCNFSFTAIQTTTAQPFGFVAGLEQTLHLKFRTRP